MNRPLKTWIICTGTGRIRRGIETFALSAFEGLRGIQGHEIDLFVGAGVERPNLHILPCLFRDHQPAQWIGKLFGRDGYVVEQWSSFIPLLLQIWKAPPDIIFYGDANLGFLLYRFRNLFSLRYRLIYHNGGPCSPPFVRTDYVQQLSPLYYQEAIEYGESSAKHFQVPIGIDVGEPVSRLTNEARDALRTRLGLPLDRPVVLSVGWIRSNHKRMDYLIREIAQLPRPRPYLVMLGQQDEGSRAIAALAKEALGGDNYTIRTVAQPDVSPYYEASDIFVLASLVEAFGIVYLEALLHGLPTIGHRHPVIEYVLGSAGILGDLSQPGNLASILEEQLDLLTLVSDETVRRRWESVRDRFSWEVLRPQYAEMFRACATQQIHH